MNAVYLRHTDIDLHERNMRVQYEEAALRGLADSIKAMGGVLHPLIVVQQPNGRYIAVDGNRRIKACQLLGNDAPKLECKVVTQAEAEQGLSMLVSNVQREDVDPVSEALHYQRLKQDEGLSVRDISKRTGIAEARIHSRLKILELEDPEIFRLMARGDIACDPPVVRALLTVTNKADRRALTEKMANTTRIALIEACNAYHALNEHKAQAKAARKAKGIEETGSPMLDHAMRNVAKEPTTSKRETWEDVRAAAKAMCKPCPIRESSLPAQPEPAWSLISHMADQVCDACDLKQVRTMCATCPGVALLRGLVRGGHG